MKNKQKSKNKDFLTGMKKYYPHFFLFILLLVVILPIKTLALDPNCVTSVSKSSLTIGIPTDACIAADGFGAFAILINNIINWFLTISVSVAAITFAIAGGKMLLNPENPTKRSEAIEMFKKTLIGMLVILGAWIVVHTVIGALTGSTSGTGALRFLQG